MKRNMIETLVGAVVVVVAVIFVGFAYSSANPGAGSGYEVTASFNRVGGLTVGGDVRMSGIRIGTITGLTLDRQSFQARVTMAIDADIPLAEDSVAAIASEGLLGGHYLDLTPGALPDPIPPGGEIEFTQDPVDIVQLLGKFIFSAGDGAQPPQTGER